MIIWTSTVMDLISSIYEEAITATVPCATFGGSNGVKLQFRGTGYLTSTARQQNAPDRRLRVDCSRLLVAEVPASRSAPLTRNLAPMSRRPLRTLKGAPRNASDTRRRGSVTTPRGNCQRNVLPRCRGELTLTRGNIYPFGPFWFSPSLSTRLRSAATSHPVPPKDVGAFR